MSEAGIRGNLRVMALPDLLQWISNARNTGILVLERGPICKKIFFREGTIVSSSSNDPQEFLGQFLLRHRWITEEQLRSAMEVQRRSGKMLGQVLLDENALQEKDLMRLLTRKAEETIYNLFLWEDGEFRFEPGTVEQEAVSISLKVADVLLEGARRYDTAQQIRKDFPSNRMVLAKSDGQPPKELISHPMAARLYELVDGNRTIADICLELHAPEFAVSWALHRMYHAGAVKPAREREKEKPGPSRSDSLLVLIQQAKGMVDKGNFEPALVLLEQIRGQSSQNLEVPYLIRQAEAGFVDRAYKHYLPPKKIPVLARSLETLTAEPMTPEEGFLVSRVNGSWDVEAIVSISPLREVEVLRILKMLREKGIIDLQDSPDGSPK